MKLYGLVGRKIEYSFSRNFFKNKFEKEKIDAVYQNFDLQDLTELPEVLKTNPNLRGLNVTIPYKEQIIPFLNEIDPVAEKIGAINTIKIEPSGALKGYNTDYFGFKESLKPYLKKQHSHALILGTGGASKAIAYALQEMNILFQYVSRTPAKDQLSYSTLTREHFQKYKLLINCTPLGTYPAILEMPAVPVEFLNREHLIFDLIYNPPVTTLMEVALQKGAAVLNGQRMLELQAEYSWKIWNK